VSDRIRTAPDVPTRHAGVGLNITFLCACCGRRCGQLGSRVRMRLGVRQRICSACADKAAAAQGAA
jgi:hypothetical protein